MERDEDGREALVKKNGYYYENCPGCKVDRANELNQASPFKYLLYIWMLTICTTLPVTCIFPFLYFMAYATEIFREEHQAKGFATFYSAWGIALVIGPALGGYLALVLYLILCARSTHMYPYFLSCFVISAFAPAVLVSCIWLPETLHKHNVSNESNEDAETSENETTERTVQKNGNILLNWPLMSSIIVYCVFSLHDVTYTKIFSLWAVIPLEWWGLNFATDDVGDVLSISRLALLLNQIFLYAPLEIIFGPINLAHIATPMIDTGLYLLQTRAVEQHQRGVANGIAMTSMSLFKAVGPAGGGVIGSQKRLNTSFLPGTHLVFFALNLVEVLGILMMFKPFLAEKKKTDSEQSQ